MKRSMRSGWAKCWTTLLLMSGTTHPSRAGVKTRVKSSSSPPAGGGMQQTAFGRVTMLKSSGHLVGGAQVYQDAYALGGLAIDCWGPLTEGPIKMGGPGRPALAYSVGNPREGLARSALTKNFREFFSSFPGRPAHSARPSVSRKFSGNFLKHLVPHE